jgi:hypothetical protein
MQDNCGEYAKDSYTYEGRFAVSVAIDLLSFATIANIHTCRKWEQPISRTWILGALPVFTDSQHLMQCGLVLVQMRSTFKQVRESSYDAPSFLGASLLT